MTIPTHYSRSLVTIACALFTATLQAQDSPSLKDTLRTWVETMQKRQQQQEDWKRDQENLANYKEGLLQEMEQLKKYINDAKDRAASEDKQTSDLAIKIEAYLKAQKTLSAAVRELENRCLAQAKTLPQVLLKEVRTSQLLADITKDAAATGEKETEALPKRLSNILSLLGETEKWQQATHVRDELHKIKDGREMNFNMLYLGLSAAYGVTAEGNVAIVGTPTPDGWRFEEKPELFNAISEAIASTKGDRDPSFTTLPVFKP